MEILIVAAAILLLLVIYICIEQHMLVLRMEDVRLSRLPAQWDGLRVLQISDLHHRKVGRRNCRLLKIAEKQKPDWIVITGDLVSRDFRAEKELADVWAFLTGLRKIAPVFLCLGNHELDLIQTERFQPLQRAITETGCQLLDNEKLYFEKNGARICVAGASLKYGVYRDENGGYRNLQTYTTYQLESAIGKREEFTILLAHNPLMMETYAAWGADLVLSGHVHGGIVRLPGVGGLLSPERRFFPKYNLGFYQNRGTYMYVSGGIGKLRLLNPPEISLLYLKSVKK